MKVKSILILLFAIAFVVSGLTYSIILNPYNSDTIQINERYDMTIDVIHIRQHPSTNKLFLVVYEYYDPICGCYEEITIKINPLEYRSEIENMNFPITIKMSGTKTNSIYNIEYMTTFV